jgi:hypothetical protein
MIGYAWSGWQSALGAFLIAGVARGGLPPALHVLYQFALPLHRQAPVFLQL